jgi:phage terminase Nu1 subunit (DNA packaging protein)
MSLIVDAESLAKYFYRDIRTIQHWAQYEGMPKEERGKYNIVLCARWRIGKLEEKIKELEKGDATLYQLQQEYQKLRNEEKALDLEVKKRNLLDRETVEITNTVFLKLIVQNIKALGPRLNKKLTGDANTLAIINAEIDELLKTISQTPLSYFEEQIPGEDEE